MYQLQCQEVRDVWSDGQFNAVCGTNGTKAIGAAAAIPASRSCHAYVTSLVPDRRQVSQPLTEAWLGHSADARLPRGVRMSVALDSVSCIVSSSI